MKNTSIVYFALALLLICQFSCEKEKRLNLLADVPDCVENEIRNEAFTWEAVYEQRIDGEVFYLFDPGPRCFDCGSVLYDASCNIICVPSGTITGQGDGRCPDFSNAIIEETLVWELAP